MCACAWCDKEEYRGGGVRKRRTNVEKRRKVEREKGRKEEW